MKNRVFHLKVFAGGVLLSLVVSLVGCNSPQPQPTQSHTPQSQPPVVSQPGISPLASPIEVPVIPKFPGQLAYHSELAGNFNIYVLKGASGSIKQLTEEQSAQVDPVWSPDGKQIAYTSGQEDPNNLRLYMMNADGSNARPLAASSRGDNWAPTWSPDGKRILFQTNRDGNFEIYAVTVADGTEVNLTNNPAQDSAPAWSPDGQQIAFASQQESAKWQIYLMTGDGGNQRRLLSSESNDMEPVWSPDGQWIFFQSDRDGGKYHLFKMKADGSEVTQLTRGDYNDIQVRPVADGSQLFFVTDRNRKGDPDWDIYLMNADGSNAVPVIVNMDTDRGPNWHP